MTRRWPLITALTLGLVGTGLVPTLDAGATVATKVVAVSPMVPASLSADLPLIRLHFSTATSAAKLPALKVTPATATTWRQVSARDVEAFATVPLRAAVVYTIAAPVQMRCTTGCTFTRVRPHAAWIATSPTWEAQLLAELHYLPLSFTPNVPGADPTQSSSGRFTWAYSGLPVSLERQWTLGADNVILRGALMRFQDVTQLPVTGVADAQTWSTLIGAVKAGTLNPGSYNYVDVSMNSPETLTLFVNGRATFHALVNTGIAVSPTETGTYPVYLRYISQTMSGTNPDGTHYSDPGIPWVSYFHGGDALHGFIRPTYGWPQSLGCVEMPFTSAKIIWPYTPIGTLVTVR